MLLEYNRLIRYHSSEYTFDACLMLQTNRRVALKHVPLGFLIFRSVHCVFLCTGSAVSSINLESWLYHPLITAAVRHKVIVIGIAVGLFALSFLVFTLLGGEFIPQLDE